MRARAPSRQTDKLQVVLAFLFGCLALGSVLWLAFRNDTLSASQFEILRVILALAGGGVGAILPGFLDMTAKTSTQLALRAGGALAIFLVLYFWSPARWESSSSPEHQASQRTEGAGSPIQSGNGNSVIINNGAKSP